MIGVVIAMKEEAVPFINAVGAKPAGIVAKRSIFTAKYTEPTSKIKDTLCIMVSGIGRSNASRATAALIDLGCRAIFNYGSCGCTYKKPIHKQGIAFVPDPGSVWIPDLILDGEFDLSAFTGKKDRDPVHLFKNFGEQSSENEIRLYTVNHFSTTSIDGGAYLVDMEAYDVLSVCDALNIPCRVVKVVSDGADDESASKFDKTLGTVVEQAMPKVLEEVGVFYQILHGLDHSKPQHEVRK